MRSLRTAEGVVQCHCGPWILLGSCGDQEIPEDCKKANITPAFKKGRKEDTQNGRWNSLSSNHAKAMEKPPKNSFQTHEGQGDHKQAAGICHAWPPCREITGSAHEGRAVDVFYLDLYKTPSAASHNTLVDKLKKHRLEKCPVRWTEYWLSFGAEKALVNGTKFSWRPATSSLCTAGTAAYTA